MCFLSISDASEGMEPAEPEGAQGEDLPLNLSQSSIQSQSSTKSTGGKF